MAGCRAGGKNNGLGVRFPPFADEFEGNKNLPDAYGVHIKTAFGLIFLAAFVNAEALPQTGADATSFFHFNEVAGNGNQQENRQQKVVDEQKNKALHDCLR